MSRPKGSKNKKTLEAINRCTEKLQGITDIKIIPVTIDKNPDADKIFPKEKSPILAVPLIEIGKPEYHEDGSIKIAGRYEKYANGTTFLYCYHDECWKNLIVCDSSCWRNKDKCCSYRMYQGNPIIQRRTQREMKKRK